MSLPDDRDMAWPPPGAVPEAIHTWRAWYAGNPAQLASSAAPPAENKYARAFFFWRRQRQKSIVRQPPPVHVPLAAEIAQTSADLLFGEIPGWRDAARSGGKRPPDERQTPGNARCGGSLGHYLRSRTAVSDSRLIRSWHCDARFRYGRLSGDVLARAAGRGAVWRHLERRAGRHPARTLRGRQVDLGVSGARRPNGRRRTVAYRISRQGADVVRGTGPHTAREGRGAPISPGRPARRLGGTTRGCATCSGSASSCLRTLDAAATDRGSGATSMWTADYSPAGR